MNSDEVHKSVTILRRGDERSLKVIDDMNLITIFFLILRHGIYCSCYIALPVY